MSKRIFWATCPSCTRPFLVSWELRHAGYDLICPYCRTTFAPDQAAALDERQ